MLQKNRPATEAWRWLFVPPVIYKPNQDWGTDENNISNLAGVFSSAEQPGRQRSLHWAQDMKLNPLNLLYELWEQITLTELASAVSERCTSLIIHSRRDDSFVSRRVFDSLTDSNTTDGDERKDRLSTKLSGLNVNAREVQSSSLSEVTVRMNPDGLTGACFLQQVTSERMN